ncbi:MAG: DUF4115 domain-containing protein [Bacteroidales bacterium]|nr:DUF4115 domain-containing protein [Bacteroidales bacterium]
MNKKTQIKFKDIKEPNEIESSKYVDQHDDVLQKDSSSSPGTILRNAREQSNTPVKYVAKKLFLETKIIRALENDQYDELPTVFVHGYLRNYAKLQKIPQDTLQESFEMVTTQPATLAPIKSLKFPLTFYFGQVYQILLLFIGIPLIAIMFLEWIFYPTTNHIYQSQKLLPSPNIIFNDEYLKSNYFLPVVMAGQTNLDENSLESDAILVAQTQLNPDKNNSIPSKIDKLAVTEISTETPINPYQTIRIHFKDRAWIKITDKERKRLYQDIGQTGEILSVEGIPPFNIKVGNLAGVYVEYNSKINNVKSFPKSKSNKRTYIIGNNTVGLTH